MANVLSGCGHRSLIPGHHGVLIGDANPDRCMRGNFGRSCTEGGTGLYVLDHRRIASHSQGKFSEATYRYAGPSVDYAGNFDN